MDLKRISRLTSILILLQGKRLLTATELAEKYDVSVRTIYRDIRALEDAGVPIETKEGRGYFLMDHFQVPPIMFNENEVNALILAEQLVLLNKDASLVKYYSDAIAKIKSVLGSDTKTTANLLADRTRFDQNLRRKRTSNILSELQSALTHFHPLQIEYCNEQGKSTVRVIEPFALVTTDNWLVIAWCRLRKGYRYFRLDRVGRLTVLSDTFEPHNMTLQQYFDKFH